MSNILKHHDEPEKPLVYEPPDLHGRKHVEKITGEFRYREDECLADKLQSEEFNMYFESNKLARRVGKMDIVTAKMIFLKEVEESGLLTSLQLKELCGNDSFVAEELTRRIEKELDIESERKIAREMQDEEFARYLQAKEKKRLLEDRNIRLQRRLAEERRLQLLQQEEETINEDRNNGYEPNATESKTYVESQRFRDEEQRKAEEENDRLIAIRLQNEEALKYKRARAEKQRRKRESKNKNALDEASHVPSENSELLHNDIRAKQPLSVDGFENYISSQDFDQVHHQQQVPCEEEPNGEHIYLKSIDACGYPNEPLSHDLVQSSDKKNLKFNQLQRRRKQSNGNVDECLFKEDDATLNHPFVVNNLQSLKVLTQPVSIYDPDNPIAVRNVKRSSVKEEKKKKKWFSTKEKF